LVRPGVRIRDDRTQEPIGVPFGSYARLLLIDLQSAALEKGSREIHMGRSVSAVVARIGATKGGPTNGKIVDQLERLAACNIDFAFGNEKRGIIVSQRLVDAFEYVGNNHFQARPNLRVIERLLLSQAFFDELRRHPVVVDKKAVQGLATSPLAIDVYLWLAYRLFSLERETNVGWERLWRQFGVRVGLLKNFRTQFLAPLHLALSAYPSAKVRVSDRGLLLEPSPPPVAA
jgi:hypothetical protein